MLMEKWVKLQRTRACRVTKTLINKGLFTVIKITQALLQEIAFSPPYI
jgi:hypothetical protein